MVLKERIRRSPFLFSVIAPPVRILKFLQPQQLKFAFIKGRCFRRYAAQPILKLNQSGIESRFHTLSAKNYWHIYLNRGEMDAYLGTALLPGDTVLDIGGHVGAYTIPVAKYVGSKGHVYVFEPEDDGRAAIERNIALNSITNCTTLDLAIGERDGTVSFFVRPEKDTHSLFEKSNAPSPTGRLLEQKKTMRSIDSLVGNGEIPRPDFIKLDIEGAELLALEGMRETIKGVRAIYVECHTALKVDLGLGEPVPLVTEKLLNLGASRVTQTDEFHVLGFFKTA